MTNAELNRAVAEKVMGWGLYTMGGYEYYGTQKGTEGYWVDSWNPAERIDHAWMVAEKLKQRQYFLILSENPLLKAWKAKFTNIRTPDCDVQKFGDTAPLAICLAALEAVKEE